MFKNLMVTTAMVSAIALSGNFISEANANPPHGGTPPPFQGGGEVTNNVNNTNTNVGVNENHNLNHNANTNLNNNVNSNTNTNTNTNVGINENTNLNNQGQHQGQMQGQDQGQQQGQSLTGSQEGFGSGNETTLTFEGDTYRVPASAPALAALVGTQCMGSASASGSGMSFGFGVGLTYTDVQCDLRESIKVLAALGLVDLAREVAMDLSGVQDALDRMNVEVNPVNNYRVPEVNEETSVRMVTVDGVQLSGEPASWCWSLRGPSSEWYEWQHDYCPVQ